MRETQKIRQRKQRTIDGQCEVKLYFSGILFYEVDRHFMKRKINLARLKFFSDSEVAFRILNFITKLEISRTFI